MSEGRYFIAVDLPDGVRAALAALREPYRGFAWTPEPQLHLTLRFIGAMEVEAADRLAKALGAVSVEPFMLPLEGAGSFPVRGRPKALWVGVGSGHPRLFQLRKGIDDTLLAEGIPADLRAFHPHVTLARLRPEGSVQAAAAFVRRHREFKGPDFRVDRFALYSSELTPSGAKHRAEAAFPLSG